ncbi:putative ribonuclease H-like domain-containing protein [Tanacetum coccineum]
MRANRYYQRTCKKIFINANDTAGYDKSKVECFKCHKMVHFTRECRASKNKEGQFRYQDNTRKQGNNKDTSSKAMLAIDGVSFDWSDMAEEQQEKEGIEFKIKKFDNASKSINKLLESQITDKSKKGLRYNVVPSPHPFIYNRPKKLDLSYSGLDELKDPEFKSYGSKDSKLESNIVCDTKSDDSKENYDDSLVKEQVSEDTSSFVESLVNVDKETIFLVDKKIELVKPKSHEKPFKKLVKYAEMYRSQSPRGNQRNWNGQKSNQLGSDFVMYNIACFICGSFDHVQINCNYHQRERMVSRNNYNGVNYDYYAKTRHPSAHRNMTPRAVSLKTGLTPLNTVRPVNTAHPKPAVHSTKSMSHFFKQAQSTNQRPFYKKTTLTSRYVNQKINTAMRHYHTERPSAVNTARSCTAPVNAIRAKRGKPQQDDTGFINSGCSRHMTGNITYLLYFNEFDGCYVTFGGGAHGGRISGKGSLKTDSLDFKDVYFVNELNFNTFSVSQMCDKKNYVLFTDTECLVLSPNFKLPDESQILLKIPRKDNMYSFDMKNIVPKESLTCLVAKATLDESMLWHMRLGKQEELNEGYTILRKEKSGSRLISCCQVEDGPHNESDEKDKSEDDSSPKEVNAAGQHVNTASLEVNTGRFKLNIVDPSVNTASSNDQDSPKDMFKLGASHTLEATHVEFFSDEDEPEVDLGNITNSYTVPTTPNTRIHKDHPIKNVIGDVKSTIQTRRMTKSTSKQGFLSVVYEQKTHDTLNTCLYACFLSQIEPTSIAKALSDSSWVEAMQEELLQFKLQQVWKLVDLPNRKRAIGTKWVFRNKKDERGIVIRNKARLVAQGHRQEEGIDYEEVFAPVARIKAIRLFLAYASFMGFLVYQMDVKSAFLYETIEEERAKGDILLVHVYVDDIIFGSTNNELCIAFEKLMKDKFHMSSMGELTFFLGLQEKPLVKDGDVDDVDVHLYRSMIGSLMYLTASRPDIMFAISKGKPTLGLWYSRDSPFELVTYTDSDYARTTQDRKSTTRVRLDIVLLDSKLIAGLWNVANLLTKGFDVGRFQYLVSNIRIKRFLDSRSREVREAQHKNKP